MRIIIQRVSQAQVPIEKIYFQKLEMDYWFC